MIISKRQYYFNFWMVMAMMGMFIFIGIPVANHLLWHFNIIDKICKSALIIEITTIIIVMLINVLINGGIKKYIDKLILLHAIESNLLSIGAYVKKDNKVYAELPKIKIRKNTITIKLSNLRIRNIIERYLNSFSTALPDKYVVSDYYITSNNAEVIITYEDIETYKQEEYSLFDYKYLVNSYDLLEFYFDKKHVVNFNDYPHWLISGTSGSGKSYFVNEIVIQAIIKGWQVVILDIKRSYGLYKDFTDYYYELDDILEKLKSVESEMSQRMAKLQPALDKNPQVLAVDIGFKPMLIVIEEYISLQSMLDKKSKEELERLTKNLSVLARQSNIHLLMVMQSAGTENINATTRSNLNKVLLGNAQSNILVSTFGNNADLPAVKGKMEKGEGLIQQDRISILRVPKITDIEDFNKVIV